MFEIPVLLESPEVVWARDYEPTQWDDCAVDDTIYRADGTIWQYGTTVAEEEEEEHDELGNHCASDR